MAVLLSAFLACAGPIGDDAPPLDKGPAATTQSPRSPTELRELLDSNPDGGALNLEFARSLGHARAQRGPCPDGATLTIMLSHVLKAVALDPMLASKLNDGSELEPLRASVQFRLAVADAPPQSLTELLIGTHWFNPPAGVLGHSQRLELNADGLATLVTRSLGDQGIEEDTNEGQWSAAGDVVTVQVESQTTSWTLGPHGNLVRDGETHWFNLPSECAA